MNQQTSNKPRLLDFQVFIYRNFSPLEADFQHYYGINLPEACWGRQRLSVRRLLSLVKHLPRGSALARSIDPKGAHWSEQEELLAVIAEGVDASNRFYLMAHGDKTHHEPLRVPRPYEPEPAETREMTLEDVLAQFPKWEANN